MILALTGGTGLIGQALIKKIAAGGGHPKNRPFSKIHLITRDVAKTKGLPKICRAFAWPGYARPFPKEAFPKDSEWGLIHLAGEPIAQWRQRLLWFSPAPFPARWTGKKKARIYNSRVKGTKALTAAVRIHPRQPKFFLSASAAGIYGERGGSSLTEESCPLPGFSEADGGIQKIQAGKNKKNLFLRKVCLDWEAESLKLSRICRTAVFRFGAVLAKEGFLACQAELAKKAPFVLSSKNPVWMSWIHIEDAVRMLLWAAASESAKGAYNGAAPRPLTFSGFSQALSEIVRPKGIKIPIPLVFVKRLGGELSACLLASCRALPERAESQGFRFKHPEGEAALRDLLQTVSRPSGSK